jgi:hypothetical protein
LEVDQDERVIGGREQQFSGCWRGGGHVWSPSAGLLGLAFHESKVRAAMRAFFDVLMMVIP